ncbi:MAG: valine--tRNA ligase [Pseudomonadota bacterium]
MPMEKTFNAAEAEPRLTAAWEAAGAFKAGANAKPGAESFCILIPPPNVTGALHIGHAFNNTLQDILTRWHRMRGYDTLWQPGTDHAGIATQMVVERELAKTNRRRTDFTRDEFLELVWQQKHASRNNIRHQLERLGASCDWSREAFTMGGAPGDPDAYEGAPSFHDAVIKVFVDLYNKGLIYRGKRLVNWDPMFESAISDLEVENIETPGHMWHFKYPLAGGATYEYVEKDVDGKVILQETRDYISIATTRPETMLGDGAVAVHPSDERYAPIVGKLCEIPVGPKDERRLIPIITDEYPDPEFGSGAVKITGAHDFNDYQVAKRGGIPMYRLMDTKGAMRADGAPYAEEAAKTQALREGAEMSEAEIDAINLVPDVYRGLDRFEARTRVVADITAEGLAVMTSSDDPRLGKPKKQKAEEEDAPTEVPLVEAKLIMQPYGDRSKVVIEPMLTDQWFVEAEQIVGPAIEAVRSGETEILPEQNKKVYLHWLENIEPWCISRQLWWGHRIPVWYGLNMAMMGDKLSAAGLTPESPPEDWDGIDIGAELAFDGLVQAGEHSHCAAEFGGVSEKFLDDLAALPAPLNHARIVEVEDKEAAIHTLAEALAAYAAEDDPTKLIYPVWRDPDVLDTWFSSGLWPIGTLGWPEETEEMKRYFPTSVLITGFDIIFFWVARMMMMQYAVVGQKPFDTVYVHALVRDEKGKKMSKSLGNVLDPLDLINDYGADAVRFTLASMAAMGRDLKLSKDRIAGYRNFGTKLWNAIRFAEMNGVYEAATPTAPTTPSQTANRWIIGETASVREEVDAALDAYRFDDAAKALYGFVWGKVCDWYLEFSKPLFDSKDAEIIAETRQTMGWVLDQCLVLLHPFMPFITEELWAATGDRAKLLVHADWPMFQSSQLVDDNADHEMNWVIGLIEEIRSVRAQMGVPVGTYLPLLQLDCSADGQAAYANSAALINRLARIEKIEETDALPKGAVTVTVEGATFGLPLADAIDVAAETARLEKTLGKLGKDIGGLSGRLNNPKFVQSAPEDVVDETRDLLSSKEDEANRIKSALARLAEMA